MAGHTLSYMATLNSSGFMTGLNQMLSGLSGFSGSLNGLKSALGGLGKLLTNPFVLGAAAVTGIALALGSATAAAMQWEDQMANVAKTTGMTGQVLADMSKNILDISTNSRTSQQDLAAIAATGGTLGISDIDKLTGFTEDINMMTVAFDMTGEEAATQMAHVANSFNAPIEQVQQMGNSINILGNNFATTERDIISALEAIAPIAKQYNETIADSAAYSTVLLQQGVDPSEVGTGLQSALKVAAGDPKKMSAWADLMGISVDELNQKLSTDLYGTLQQSGDALSSVENEVERNALAMELWGAFGGKQIGKLIGQEENLARAREMANEQYGIAAGDQGALVDEYNAKNNTSLGIISQIKNTIGAMVIEMGGVVNSSSLMQGALTGIHSALITIRDVGHKAFDFLKTSDITKSLGSMTSGIQKYISSMTGTLSKLFDPIKQSIEKVFGEGAIGKGIGALFNNLTNGAEAAFEIIGKGFEMLASGVEALGPIFETVGKGIGEAVEWAGALSKTIKEYSSGSSTIQKIGDAFEKLKSPIETVKTAWEGFTNAMPTAVSGAVDAIQTLFQKFFDWLDEKLNIGDTIKEKLGIGEGGFIDSLLKNKEEIENVGKEVGQEFTEEALAQTDGLAPGIEEDLMNTDAGSAGSSKGAEFVENFEESLKAMELADYYSNVGERPNTTEFNIGPEIGDTGFSIGKRTARGKKEEWAIFTDTGHKSFEAEELSTGVGWLPFLREQLGEITPLMQLYIDLSEAVAVGDEDSAIALRKKIDETLAYQEALEEFMNTGVILDFDKAWEDFSKDAANVFSDNLVSGVEASNMIERLTTLKSTDKDAFERMGGDAAIEWWSGLEALIKERSETLAIDPNTDVSKMDEQIREYLKDNPYTVELTGEITDIFGNVEPEQLMFNFAENWEDNVKKIKEDVTDWNLFRKNVALPALKQSLEHEKQLLSTGSESNYKVVKDYIDDLVKLYGEMPEAFGKAEIELINSLQRAAGKGASHQSLIDLMDKYLGTEKATKDLADSTKNLYNEYNNLDECISSTFSEWRNQQPDMFYESIIGSTENYIARVKELAELGRASDTQIEYAASLNGQSVDEFLGKTAELENAANIEAMLESDQALTDAGNLESDISAMVPEMEVSLLTTNALLDAQSLFASIERMNPHMQVSVDVSANAGQIADIAQAAVRDAIASAYSG
jgi:TP901 family phage tail tape measure protein